MWAYSASPKNNSENKAIMPKNKKLNEK